MMNDYSGCGGGCLRWIAAVFILLFMIISTTHAAAEVQIFPDYNNIFFTVANDAGVKYNAFGNNTYNVRFEGVNRGLNALHISTDPAANFGQVTVTENQTGTFYATDSGGKHYEDEIILMVAVNGTIPDTFRLHVKADGYTWTPNTQRNVAPPLDTVTYQSSALDEVFTKEDFMYGPQIWKPTGNEVDYPIYAGQDLTDTENTFQMMFIDLNAGVLAPNTALENRGAVRINYSFENLDSFAAFNVYAYCKNSNNGDDMVAWSNALTPDKAMSGYSVIGAGFGPAPSRIEVSPATAALTVGDEQQFAAVAYDADANAMTGITFLWSSSNETVGTIDGNDTFTALATGTTMITAQSHLVRGMAKAVVNKTVFETVWTDPCESTEGWTLFNAGLQDAYPYVYSGSYSIGTPAIAADASAERTVVFPDAAAEFRFAVFQDSALNGVGSYSWLKAFLDNETITTMPVGQSNLGWNIYIINITGYDTGNHTFRIESHYDPGTFSGHSIGFYVDQIEVRIDPDAPPTVLFGDSNDDGRVNQADTLRVLRQIVGLSAKPTVDTERFVKTDVNRNGVIEMGDALFIAQYNVGLRNAWFVLRG